MNLASPKSRLQHSLLTNLDQTSPYNYKPRTGSTQGIGNGAPPLPSYYHTARDISRSFVLTVLETNRSAKMLSSAVERADKVAPIKKTGLAKPSFPSSSPTLVDAFKIPSQLLAQHGGRRGLTTSNILRQSAQSILNKASATRRNVPSSNNLKRTVQLSCLPTNEDGKQSPLVSPVATAYNSSIFKLHEGVYFDENDIDFSSDPLAESPPRKTATSKEPTLPTNSEGKLEAPDSSTPFPWSSSPLEHRLPSQQAARGNGNRLVAEASSTADGNPRKRRTIPWVDRDAADDQREAWENSPGFVPGTAAAGRRPKRIRSDGHSPSVTRPTPTNLNPHPWNKTASDVKEEQKRLRQTNKRLVKTNEATEEDKAKAIAEKKKRNVIKVFLSDEQRNVEHLVVEKGNSVFFTGSAGTGKSVLLRSIITSLRKKFKNEPDRVAVTASTGLAACNVGGVTLHSFSGIGLGKEPVKDLVRKIRRNPKAKNRWLRTKVLIIDEISMVDADLFDKLEGVARVMRSNGRPFGGIQLIITGDFFQLPPVPDNGKIAKFAFEAAAWSTCLEHTIGLTQVFRQKDPTFAQMLNEMRLGKLSKSSIDTFRKLCRPIHYTDGLEATELFPTRYEVENANNVRMRSLPGQGILFNANDTGTITDKMQRDKILSSCMAPQSIELKPGSQVMLIKNMDESLVNGLLGKVIGFMDEKTFDIYHENEDGYRASEDLDSDGESMDQSKKKIRALLNKNAPGDTKIKWPLVRFVISDGTSRDLLCSQETWKIELPNGEIQASRSQIPLILAWALSIHKAQGQTLERVKVDLGRVFEKGQAYVALSRATCQEGLQVLRFDPAKVMAHEKVRNFYNKLYTVNEARKGRGFNDGDGYFEEEDELRAMAG